MRSTRAEFVSVFKETFSKAYATKKEPHVGPHDVAGFDESAEEYSDKIGRWTREVLISIGTDDFWGWLGVAHTTRIPLDRLHNWLQSALEPGQPPKLVTLVVTKATLYLNEFDELLSEYAYGRVWSDLLQSLELRYEPPWLSLIVQVYLGIAHAVKVGNSISDN